MEEVEEEEEEEEDEDEEEEDEDEDGSDGSQEEGLLEDGPRSPRSPRTGDQGEGEVGTLIAAAPSFSETSLAPPQATGAESKGATDMSQTTRQQKAEEKERGSSSGARDEEASKVVAKLFVEGKAAPEAEVKMFSSSGAEIKTFKFQLRPAQLEYPILSLQEMVARAMKVEVDNAEIDKLKEGQTFETVVPLQASTMPENLNYADAGRGVVISVDGRYIGEWTDEEVQTATKEAQKEHTRKRKEDNKRKEEEAERLSSGRMRRRRRGGVAESTSRLGQEGARLKRRSEVESEEQAAAALRGAKRGKTVHTSSMMTMPQQMLSMGEDDQKRFMAMMPMMMMMMKTFEAGGGPWAMGNKAPDELATPEQPKKEGQSPSAQLSRKTSNGSSV